MDAATVGVSVAPNFMVLIVAGLGLALIIGLVVLVVALATRGKRSPANTQAVAAAPAMSPEQQQEVRTQVLQELSEGKITREEAEQKMAAMRRPRPQPAQATGGTASSGGRGCLWGILIAVIAGLCLLMMFLMFFTVNARQVIH